jgi:hypothetical protein
MANLTYAMPAFPGYAGYKFGVSPKDLAKKYGFEDDEEGNVIEFGGPYLPTATTTTHKGRGNVLGYQTGGAPTVEQTVFSQAPLYYKPIEPEAPETTEPEAPETTEPEEPEKPEDRFLRSFIGKMGDPAGKTIGAMGVGRAMEYGYTKPEILAKAQQEGITFGEQAARGLDLPYVSDLTGARGAGADPNYPKGLGLEAVKRLESQGYSQQAIQGIAAQQGIKFGQAASSYLGGAPRVSTPAPPRVSTPAPAATIESIGKREAQPQYQQMTGSIGKAGLERAATELGISLQEAARRAQAQGTTLGPAAMALLG